MEVRKRTRISNRYNQATYLTQDTNGKVTTSQLDITNESQEVSPFCEIISSLLFKGAGSDVVDTLFIVTPIVWGSMYAHCFVIQY